MLGLMTMRASLSFFFFLFALGFLCIQSEKWWNRIYMQQQFWKRARQRKKERERDRKRWRERKREEDGEEDHKKLHKLTMWHGVRVVCGVYWYKWKWLSVVVFIVVLVTQWRRLADQYIYIQLMQIPLIFVSHFFSTPNWKSISIDPEHVAISWLLIVYTEQCKNEIEL